MFKKQNIIFSMKNLSKNQMKLGIKKILVPLDFSESSKKGLMVALLIAKQFEASITALYVSHKSLPNISELSTDFLNQAKKQSLEQGINFKKEISKGKPSEKIPKFAETNEFDLIIIGARGLSKTKKILLGSVSKKVIDKSKVPVLIIK